MDLRRFYGMDVWGIFGVYIVVILLLLPFHPPWTYDAYGEYRWEIQLSAETVGRILTLVVIGGGAVGGGIFGAIQHSILRLHFGKVKGWVATTALGWALECGLITAISWYLQSNLTFYHMDGLPQPPTPIQDFSLLGWLFEILLGLALGTILAGLVQGFLLRKHGRSLPFPLRAIWAGWPLTTLLGTILGIFLANRIGMIVWYAALESVGRKLRWLSPIWTLLVPGLALGIFTGISLLKVFRDRPAEVILMKKRLYDAFSASHPLLCS
ncbi:MAG: hypothetical protein A2Z14_13185 [Chloroflexi bacterium RBG_16_48_8]|nr:MAG: hypothetical protein A2Z14_13185 [Chloroflexi bacterium RBG_16_48_8]